MEDPNQTVNAIPEHARRFIAIVHEKCDTDLDFSDSSIAKLDEIVAGWQGQDKAELLSVFDGMCFYLGEVIRKNLGGCWIDPGWKNPEDTEARCYLHKVAGILTVSPSKWVERRLIEGHNETFLSYYTRLKEKVKSIKRGLRKEQPSASAGPKTIGLDKSTSIIALLQFLGVLLGWMLCRAVTRISGVPESGLPWFLVKYGYTLALVPMIWAPLMVYENSTNRMPVFIERALRVFGFIAIFAIFGLFGWLVVGLIGSLGHDPVF